MYTEDIALVLKDPTTNQKTTRRVLRDNNMEIVERFSPVESEYVIQHRPNRRMIYKLEEDKFQKIEEVFDGQSWKKTFKYTTLGTDKEVENAFFKSLARFTKKYINVR